MPQTSRQKRTISQSHKDAIRRAQIARHQKLRSQEVSQPDRKPCTACGHWKDVPDDYTMRKRTLADGTVRLYPAGECKKCQAERSANHRERLREEGVLAEREKTYNERRDKEAKREYNREYGAIRRRQAGAVARGPWKKYRDKNERGVGRSTLFPIAPLAGFLEEMVHQHGISAIELATGVSITSLNEMINHEVEDISLERLDRILIGLNCAEQMHLLYPQED